MNNEIIMRLLYHLDERMRRIKREQTVKHVPIHVRRAVKPV